MAKLQTLRTLLKIKIQKVQLELRIPGGQRENGKPNDINAHPHYSQTNNLALIHNGIIENYAYLKQELVNRGYEFKSNTDTEVLIYLIEDPYK